MQFGHRESMKDGKPNQGKIVWIPFSSGHKVLAFTHKHVLYIYTLYINYAKDFQCRAPRCQFNRGRPYTAGSEALDPEAGAYLKIWRSIHNLFFWGGDPDFRKPLGPKELPTRSKPGTCCRLYLLSFRATGNECNTECPVKRNCNMGLSENRVYSQWNSHLLGIMIINHWV